MKQLARACSCKLEEVLLAAARIRELNPKPGSGYGDESYDKYIVPDIIISQTEHGFEMQLSDETLPQIAINPYYLSLMKQKRYRDGGEGLHRGKKSDRLNGSASALGSAIRHCRGWQKRFCAYRGSFLQKEVEKLAPWTQKQAAKSHGGASEPHAERHSA